MSSCMKVIFGGLRISLKNNVYKDMDLSTPEKIFENVGLVTNKIRMELVDALNKRGDIENIHSLYDRKDAKYDMSYISFGNEKNLYFTFSPIIFTLKLPITLQSLITPITQNTERFNILLDGMIMMIFTECDLGKLPSGLTDVRDKVIEIVQENDFLEAIIMPPNIAHGSFAFVDDLNVKAVRKYEVIFPVTDISDSDGNIKRLHEFIQSDLYRFFEGYQIKERIYDNKIELTKIEDDLLKILSEHINLKWWNLIKKSKIINQLEKKSVNGLKILAVYSSTTRDLERSHSKILERTLEKQLLQNIYVAGSWKDTLSYEEFSTESLLRIFDQSQKIIEVHKNAQASILSGFIGGLIGSFLTYLLSLKII